MAAATARAVTTSPMPCVTFSAVEKLLPFTFSTIEKSRTNGRMNASGDMARIFFPATLKKTPMEKLPVLKFIDG
jgi:hypothetical protein